MSDSCHIPSDKDVRYAGSEAKLQEPSGFKIIVQKMELCGSSQLYVQSKYCHNTGEKADVLKEEKH